MLMHRRRPPVLVLGLVFVILLFLRHPAGILHANFWGEDGWVWYPDAYGMGLHALVVPHTGYLQTISRLGALAAQLVPLRWAPTVFAAIALAVQVLPAVLLVSRRLDAAWPDYPSRLAFAVLYIALPNSFEEFGNLTNSQWYLALLAFLVVVSAPPQGILGRIGDGCVLVLSGLSGPFCVMLAPIAVWTWLKDRSRQGLLRLALVLCMAFTQAIMLVQTMGQTRPAGTLGLGFGNFAHIVAMKIVYGLFLGSHVMDRLAHSALWNGGVVTGAVTVVTVVALLLAWWRGGTVFRRFAVFGGLVTAAALLSPVVTAGKPAWVVLASPEAAQRYFLIPMLVLAAACVSLASNQQPWLARLGLLLCLAMGVGVAGDFPYPHMRGTAFDDAARAFADAPPGTRMAFPLLPAGTSPMILTKK